MFEQSLLPVRGTRRRWIVPCVVAGQLLAVGILIVIPMLCPQALPVPVLTSILVAPPPPPPPPAAAATRAAPRVPKVVVRQFDARRLMEPRTVPNKVATIKDLPETLPVAGVPGGIPGGVPGGLEGGVIGGILGAVPSAAPPPPPPPPPPKVAEAEPAPAAPARIRVGGQVEAARVISDPNPIYPPLAAEAHVQGVVVLDAVIGEDGHISNLKLISGSPLLAPAAMDAVKQWVYRPTFLNGRAVEVATEIDVRFQLG
jgi:periplasmic protein TonB